MAIAQKNYGDCADKLPRNMFEEGGRQRIVVEVLVLVVVSGCVLSLVFLFVCPFICFVKWRFLFYGCTIWNSYYNSYALLFEFKARYLNSKI